MNIKLYSSNSDINRVDKTSFIVLKKSLEGTLKEETSVINPSIVVTSDSSILNANYAYIELFKRYYFITNITSIRNDLWRIDLKCDVLMSFKDEIKNIKCLVARNENKYNPLLSDKKVVVQKNVNYEVVVSSESPLFESTGVAVNNPFSYIIQWIGG